MQIWGLQSLRGMVQLDHRNTKGNAMDQLDKMIAFENGELDHDEIVELFQELINSGLVWKLQGFYGRTAAQLIEAGECHA